MSNLNLSHCEKCGERTDRTTIQDGILICRECNLKEEGNHITFLLEVDPTMFIVPPRSKRARR